MDNGSKRSRKSRDLSRRRFIRNTAVGAFGLASGPILGRKFTCHGAAAAEPVEPAAKAGPAAWVIPLDRDWLFGGKLNTDALAPEFDDKAFAPVALPHCVANLSWRKWDPAAWRDVYLYRRHFSLPEGVQSRRVFLHFEGVMVGTTPTVNGHTLPQHLGGYLPSRYEMTQWVRGGANVLAVAVDCRWSNVPPEGSPAGPRSIDYLEPGGIFRPARLEVVPRSYIADVFAKPVHVLDAGRRVEVTCTIDAADADDGAGRADAPTRIEVELRDGDRVISRAGRDLRLEKRGPTEVSLTLSDLGNVGLWDVDAPRLYDVIATLFAADKPVHDYRVRTGLREARFATDGFFLNGRRLQLFGLNRHELYPYVGGAVPRRVHRRDAQILRREFNCNVVRCSHYPQSEAFLDTCDELGLMVWEEVPGWQYVGDDAWKDLLVRDVGDMVRRDRNHPAVIIWGTRANESANQPDLYRRTREVAKALDDSRPSSGSMTSSSRKGWDEDVFALDDYHARPDGSVDIREPVAGVPYMLAEAVGQFNYSARKGFDAKYRRAGDVALQQAQALRHAQAHDRAAANANICGVIAWCAFDYGSLVNPYEGVKCPGVADVFRIPKLGAAFYQAQGDAKEPGSAVIAPNFYWDFGPQTPRGPGKGAAIFSNCDRLELFLDGKPHATLRPDATNFPHLKHPPFFADLDLGGPAGGAAKPELRIDGYAVDKLLLSRSFSSDPRQDQFFLLADDEQLVGDGSDATRLVFVTADKFGAPRAFAGGEVSFKVSGPGTIVGDNPFQVADAGGAAAVWVRTTPRGQGRIEVTATHSALGTKSVAIQVVAPSER